MKRNLKPFLAPASVAVVGAAERPTSSGGAVLQNLRISGFAGEIVPVNPKGGTMFGISARKSLAELNQPAELAVIVIRPDLILDAVREAAATGHRNLLILPGGFAEAGEAGLARDKELRALIAQENLTVAGPNCAGIIHLPPGARFAATFLRDMPLGPNRHGMATLITQSGALGEEAIAASKSLAVPLGSLVSVGNAVQLGVTDYLDYLGDQDSISVVLLYIESVENAARFGQVARRIVAKKPVVALIGGRTEAGAAAARRHTGAPAQDEARIEALCRDARMLRVKSLRQLLLAAKGFGSFPQGIGKRALILSNSGGPGVLCADEAAAQGLDLPDLPEDMAAALRASLPAEAAVANPIDLLADAREDRFGFTLETAVKRGAGAFDAILGIHVVPFMVDAAPVIARMAELARAVPVPMLYSMMGTLPGKAEWFAAMEAAGVPMFNDVEAMAECTGLLARYPALKARAAADT
ncbi:MAG TPA: CoA-binding protein [Stellaceae bacterium]|nr:CoA-binding protein [Stellaceae bacterium]